MYWYDEIRELLADKGVAMPKRARFLGEGCYASAYETDDGRVMKVTSDAAERVAAELVRRAQLERGTPFKRILRIDEVFCVRGLAGFKHTLTISERLFPIADDNDRSRWPCAPDVIKMVTHGPLQEPYGDGWQRGTLAGRTVWNNRISGPNKSILERVWTEMAHDLMDAGIYEHSDLHEFNVMKRVDGQLVISDLGCTKSPHDVQPRFIRNGTL